MASKTNNFEDRTPKNRTQDYRAGKRGEPLPTVKSTAKKAVDKIKGKKN